MHIYSNKNVLHNIITQPPAPLQTEFAQIISNL